MSCNKTNKELIFFPSISCFTGILVCFKKKEAAVSALHNAVGSASAAILLSSSVIILERLSCAVPYIHRKKI